jgi:hypothetical protein
MIGVPQSAAALPAAPKASGETLRSIGQISFVVLVVLVAAYLVEALIFVSHGRTNIDEGVFLNAGRLVYEGQLPYRDFPFSQGPLLPYVYGLAIHICGPSVLVGRVVSFLLAGVGIGATLWIAHSLGGRLAAMIAMALTIVNLPALWVAMTVRTQSLGTPLVLLAALALSAVRRGVWGWAAAPSLLLWASGARLTLLLAFAAVSLWVALQLRKSRQLLMRVAAVVGAQAIVIFSPLWITPDAARFHLFTAQLTRSERGGVQQSSSSPRRTSFPSFRWRWRSRSISRGCGAGDGVPTSSGPWAIPSPRSSFSSPWPCWSSCLTSRSATDSSRTS